MSKIDKLLGEDSLVEGLERVHQAERERLPQPHKCVVYRDGECRYPIEDCSECPKHEGMREVLAERPKGKWLNKDYKSQCNCCRRVYPWQKYDRIYEENFCPKCGADMRGADDE